MRGEKRDAIAVDVLILFNIAKSKHSNAIAFDFLFAIAEVLEAGYSLQELVDVYTSTLVAAKKRWVNKRYDEEAQDAIAKFYSDPRVVGTPGRHRSENGDDKTLSVLLHMVRFTATKGIPVNSYIMNGLLDEKLDFEQGLMRMLSREQQLLQFMVQEGKLSGASEGFSKDGVMKASKDHTETVKLKSVLSQIFAASNILVTKYHPFFSEDRESIPYFIPSMEVAQKLAYLHSAGTRNAMKSVSIVLVDNWCLSGALHRLHHALYFLEGIEFETAKTTRLSIVYNPSGRICAEALAIQTLFEKISDLTLRDDGTDIAVRFAVPFMRHAVEALERTGSINVALAAESAGIPETTIRDIIDAVTLVINLPSEESLRSKISSISYEMKRELRLIRVSRGMKGEIGGTVIANGRCLFFARDVDPFVASDYDMLVYDSTARLASMVEDIVLAAPFYRSFLSTTAVENSLQAEADWRSNTMMMCSAFLGQYSQTPREDMSVALDHMGKLQSFYETQVDVRQDDINGENVSVVSITVIVDPLTEAAQRIAPLLLVLRDQLRLPLKLLFLPQLEVSEFPLQKFYRYVIEADTGETTPMAIFDALPLQHVLTMRMDVPEPWNVQSVKAFQDVDNLRCSDVICGDRTGGEEDITSIEYSLKSMAAAGQCFDVVERRPPNGLQLSLQRVAIDSKKVEFSSGDHSDTLVMQNLGYFQLRSNPGVWLLGLAAGRGSDLYEIVNADEIDGGDFKSNSSRVEEKLRGYQVVLVTAFYDTTIQMRVRKRAGTDGLKLLEDINLEESLDISSDEEAEEKVEAEVEAGLHWGSSLGNMLWGNAIDESSAISSNKKTIGETVHIFSLATGHLYERFLKVMMLSAHKRCTLPVKFWLLENFLSPTFKDSVDALAAEYKFEVSFISYKWPSWLRQQTEKQRIM